MGETIDSILLRPCATQLGLPSTQIASDLGHFPLPVEPSHAYTLSIAGAGAPWREHWPNLLAACRLPLPSRTPCSLEGCLDRLLPVYHKVAVDVVVEVQIMVLRLLLTSLSHCLFVKRTQAEFCRYVGGTSLENCRVCLCLRSAACNFQGHTTALRK